MRQLSLPLEASAKKHQIGAAKPVVLITAEKRGSVDIGTPKGRIEVERNGVAARNKRRRIEELETEASFQIPCNRRTTVRGWTLKTAVRPVEFLGIQRTGVAIERELVG